MMALTHNVSALIQMNSKLKLDHLMIMNLQLETKDNIVKNVINQTVNVKKEMNSVKLPEQN